MPIDNVRFEARCGLSPFFRGVAAIMAFLITLILVAPVHAGYLDECLQEILPLENGSYIGAMQCGYLDFFMYIDEKGKITRRNFVPPYWRDTLKLVDFIPEDRLYAIYFSDDESDSGTHGVVCDFKWNVIFDTGLQDMHWVTNANGTWWGLVDGPAIREVSFDGIESTDHPLPELKGVDYFKDLIGFTVDTDDVFIMLFSPVDESGYCKDGMIRKVHKGELTGQWLIDIPNVPEMDLFISWVSPVVDYDDNIYVAHYEYPCGAKTKDRVTVHKYNSNGAELWTWGEGLYILSDIRIARDGNIVLFRPGGPIYKLSPEKEYLGEVIIEGVTVLGEPECSDDKRK
jgi:hypothetical protein